MGNMDRIRKLKEAQAVQTVPDDSGLHPSKGRTNPPNTSTERPPAPQGSKPRPPKPPQPIVSYTPGILRSCGHAEDFPEYKSEKEDWRANRMKKFTAKKCKACGAAAAAAHNAAQPRSEKKQRQQMGKPATMDARMAAKGRLPHGSTFAVMYDALRQEWSGTLEMEGIAAFHATAPGVFRLLSKLDGLYRESLAKEGAAP